MISKFSYADFIAPSLDYLSSLDVEHLNSAKIGKWIWCKDYTRSYFSYKFRTVKEVCLAEITFQSDSKADVFLNGNVMEVNRSHNKYIADSVDVTEYIVQGENRIGIRHFCSDNPLQFHVVFRGYIHIVYADGTKQDIKTGEDWKCYRMTGFWQGTEKKNWYMQDDIGYEVRIEASNIHPMYKKRACLFRKSFQISKDVRKATLYSCALGLYVPYINGKRATEDRFIPGSMELAAEYQVYDVTKFMNLGKNILAAETGNEWYNCCSWGTFESNIPAVMMCLVLEFTDGSQQTIKTDSTWKVQVSPRVENDIQYGERYDARLEIENWNSTDDTEGFVNDAVSFDGECRVSFSD